MDGSKTSRIIENRTLDVNTLVQNKFFTTEAQRGIAATKRHCVSHRVRGDTERRESFLYGESEKD
jgi:hypothetical protein